MSDDLRLLMVAYIFPPLAGAGVYRTLKLVKYLPESGVTPVVLSADDPEWYVLDENGELAAEVPAQAELHRVKPGRTLEHVKGVYRFVSGAGQQPHATGAAPSRSAEDEARPRFRHRVLDLLRMPDEQVYWVRPAVLEGRRILEESRLDCLYSSGPPFSGHLVALRLHRLHPEIPWVADFRDAWAGNPVYMRGLTESQRRAHRDRERQVVEGAAMVVGVAPGIVDYFRHAYPDHAEKVRLFPNGFDPEDFEGCDVEPSPAHLTLAHVGELSETRDPSSLINALARVNAQLPDVPLRMRFVGYVDPALRPRLEQLIERLDLRGVVSLEQPVAHSEAICAMKSSDILVFQSAFRSSDSLLGQTYPGKLFEYMAAGRPVLGIVPEGPAAELIERTHAGWSCAPEDEACLTQRLTALAEAWRRGEPLLGGPVDVSPFDRRRIAADLAAVVRELVRATAAAGRG